MSVSGPGRGAAGGPPNCSKALLGAVLILVTGAAMGCEGPAPRERFTSRTLDTADQPEVLQAAEAIFTREFGRVRVDRARGRIESEPLEYQAQRDTGAMRELVGGESTLRRIGTCVVQREGDAVIARVRVDVQRRDTERREVQTSVMAMQGDRLTDRPQDVERGREVSTGQQEVWTPVRRDDALERAILEELRNQFAPAQAATEP